MRARSQIGWTFADQALSSLTNAALAVVVARSVNATEFGAFSVALIAFSFCVGLARCFMGDPFIIQFAAAGEDDRRRAAAAATGAALAFGVAAGAVLIVVALAVDGPERAAVAAVGAWMPSLVLQDTWRHMFFAVGRPKAATINDAVWAVAQTVLLWAAVTRDASVGSITSAWGASAALAACVGVAQFGVVPNVMATRWWLGQTRRTHASLGTGYVVNAGTVHGSTYAVGGILGLPALAALRSAQVLLGPLNLIFAAFNAYFLPAFARRTAAGRGLVRLAAAGSSVLGAVAAVWVLLLVLTPDWVGRRVLRANWEGADAVMLPSGLLLVAGALVLGASNGLMAMGRSDLLLRVTIVQAPLFLLGVTGAAWWGVEAAAYGFAIAQTVGLVACWWVFVGVSTPMRNSRHAARRR